MKQILLYEAYGKPAVFLQEDGHETCLVMTAATGRFRGDADTHVDVLSGKPDVRRVRQAEFRRLVAYSLSRSPGVPDDMRADLAEFQEIEHRLRRERRDYTPEERATADRIADAAAARLAAEPGYGLPPEALAVEG